MDALTLIYNKILGGEHFGSIDKFRLGGTYFWDVLSCDGEYIYWRHYGSSANKTGLDSLRWILKNIFQMSPEEFLFKYTTFNEWKRINECYSN